MATVAAWSFAKDTAQRTGLADRTVRLALQVAEQLSDQARVRLAGTDLARNQKELLALGALAREDQALVLDLLLAPNPRVKRVDAARKIVQGIRDDVVSEVDAQFARLADAWKRAGDPARRAFVAHLRETGALSGRPQLEEVA